MSLSNSYLTRVVVVPSCVFASGIFGGAYGSGREIVEFVSRYGPVGGLLSLASLTLFFAACLFLCFELARLTGSYNYHAFARVLLRGASPLYEAALALALLLVLTVNATASGTLLANHFGYSAVSAIVLFLLFVVVVTFFGRRIVEASMVLSFVALAVILAIVAGIVATTHRDAIAAAFAAAPWGTAGIGAGLSVGLANGGLIPLLLFCGRGLTTRRETALAAVCAAVTGIAPAAVLHVCFMLSYPQIIAVELPAYYLIGAIAPAIVLNVYVCIIYFQMVDTAVAVLWGMLEALGTMSLNLRVNLSSAFSRAAIAGAAVAIALLLTSIGLIDLIVQRNAVLFVAFILVFYLPLLLRGCSLILLGRPAEGAPRAALN